MKVLQLISGLSAGGAEHFVLELCRQSVKDAQCSMSVLTMSAVDDISYRFREGGIEVIAVAPQQKRRIKALKTLRLLVKQQHDVFHAHMFHACIIACIAKIFRPSVRIVFTLHNDHVPQWHRQLLLFITRPLRNADMVFPGMKRSWFQKKNAGSIPTGIDFNRFALRQPKSEVFTFLFAGRLQPEKNPLFLIPFAKALRAKHQFHINVAGDGPLKKELQEKIEGESLQQLFTLHGHVHDMADFLSRGHCLLLPSLWEGMPMILLEAAASSLPIIATPTGNISQLVANDEGFVGSLDEFEMLADRVINNYNDALMKAAAFGGKMKNMASIEKVYALHQDVYSH